LAGVDHQSPTPQGSPRGLGLLEHKPLRQQGALGSPPVLRKTPRAPFFMPVSILHIIDLFGFIFDNCVKKIAKM
jgi:hypothetical protein